MQVGGFIGDMVLEEPAVLHVEVLGINLSDKSPGMTVLRLISFETLLGR